MRRRKGVNKKRNGRVREYVGRMNSLNAKFSIRYTQKTNNNKKYTRA